MARPDVFISATTVDLRSYREEAKQALLDIGAHPIEQANFPTEHRQLASMLARLLDPCQALVHIVGFYYGGEPHPETNIPRRSYTQWEYHRAVSGDHPKPTYVFLAREDCRFDSFPREDEEKRLLQLRHRQEIKSRQNIYYEFSSQEELRELIHRTEDLRACLRNRAIRIPFRPLGDAFTGRLTLIETLTDELTARQSGVLTHPTALFADGGVGKTALAVELGWRLFESRNFDFVFFLNASTQEEFHSDLAALCSPSALDLQEQTTTDQQTRREAVMRWLNGPGNAERTLLLIDNADSQSSRIAVNHFLPAVARSAVLVTSRYDAWDKLRSHPLNLFTSAEARAFLQGRLRPELLLEPQSEVLLDAVSSAVDHLPLALELVASYIRRTHQTLSDWLREWHSMPQSTLSYHDPATVAYPTALARVWDLSVKRLSQRSYNLLFTLTWFAPRPNLFPLDPLQYDKDWPPIRNAFAELAEASLIQWEPGSNEVSIHKLLQLVMRHRMAPQSLSNSLTSALISLQSICPPPDWSEYGWQLWRKILPHFLAVFDSLFHHPSESQASRTMQARGLWLKHQGRYLEAEPLYRRSLELDEKALGPCHPIVITELNNLGRLLNSMNRQPEAETVLRRAVTLAEGATDEKANILPLCMVSLAQVLRDRGADSETEQILRKVLSLRDTGGSVEDVTLGSCLADLASLEERTSRFEDAEEHYRKAVSLFDSRLDAYHPSIALTLDALGQLLVSRKKLSEARPLLERALSIFTKCYGPEHANTASAIHSLGMYHFYSKHFPEAEPLLRRALIVAGEAEDKAYIRIRILNNLGWLSSITGRHKEAEELMRRALLLAENRYASDSSVILARLENLAGVLSSAGNYVEEEDVLARRIKLLFNLPQKEKPAPRF